MAVSDSSQSDEVVFFDTPVLAPADDDKRGAPIAGGSFSSQVSRQKEETPSRRDSTFLQTPDVFSPPPELANFSAMEWLGGFADASNDANYEDPPSASTDFRQSCAASNNNVSNGQLLVALERWLGSPYAASLCDCEGFVSIRDILSVCAEVKALAVNSRSAVIGAVRDSLPDGSICLHPSGRGLRFRGMLERVRLAAELHVTGEVPNGSIRLMDLLGTKRISTLMNDIDEISERLKTLKDALSTSQLVRVAGSRAVLQTWFMDCSGTYWQGMQSTSTDPYDYANAFSHTTSKDTAKPYFEKQNSIGGDDKPVAKKSCADSIEPQIGISDVSNGFPTLVDSGISQDEAAWWGNAAWWNEAWAMSMSNSAMAMTPGLDWSAYGQPKTNFDRRKKHSENILQVLTWTLENLPETLKGDIEPDGSVPMSRIFDVDPAFAKSSYSNPSVPIRALLKMQQNRLGVDATRLTVKLLNLEERLCKTSEFILREQGAIDPTPFEDLLASEQIQQLFAEAAASSQDGALANAERLKQAFSNSDVLEIVEDACGQCMVAARPANIILEKTLLEALTNDPRVLAKFKNEGEVPLAFFLDQQSFQHDFERARVYGSDARLDALRMTVQSLEQFQLEGSSEGSLSIRVAGQSILSAPDIKTTAKRTGKCIPFDKDVREFRKLIEWYFDPFNLQHNRVLLSVARAKRTQPSKNPRAFLRDAGCRPTFSLEDLCSMPRIGRILEQYYPEVRPCVLAAAMQTDKNLPLRFCKSRTYGLPRGSWAIKQPSVELTYDADFRFIEAKGDCPHLQPLLAPDIDPYAPDKPLLGNAFSVASYGISSDLSHSQSPKSDEVLDKLVAAGLEPGMLLWPVRQPLIKREILLYGADFICVQGIQSIGMAERCSEWDDGWFTNDAEPESNHLVQLYRDICASNYGVVFSPTLKLPGSDVLCFGNAIFWKRSKWQLQHRWNVPNAAVCAEFASKKGEEAPVLLCSSKVAASYAADWGSVTPLAELVQPLLPIQAGVEEAVRLRNVRPVWCGDFGCEFSAFSSGLRAGVAEVEWKSACDTILGSTPWTCVSETNRGRCVDNVLHGDGLQAVAALGGHKEYYDIVHWLRSGYPSDHLIQLAVFVPERDFLRMSEDDWPSLGQ